MPSKATQHIAQSKLVYTVAVARSKFTATRAIPNLTSLRIRQYFNAQHVLAQNVVHRNMESKERLAAHKRRSHNKHPQRACQPE